MTRPLAVGLVLDSLGSGGAQRQAVELAVRLRGEPGVSVRIAIYRPVNSSDRDLHSARLAAAGVPVDLAAKRTKFDPTLPARLGAALARCDVVHAFMPAPALWAWLALRTHAARPRPILIAAERSMPSRVSRLNRLASSFVYHRADAVTVNAQPALEELARDLRVPRNRLHYIPNGIDLAEWDSAAAQEPPWTLEPGCFHIALIGRIAPQKRHALLLTALARLGEQRRRNWRVWLVGASAGEADLARRITAQIAESGLEGVVQIVQPTDRVAALLSRVDLLVLPSSYEGFPNVVLEAMAMGSLVVAAPVGDVPSLVSDGDTGLLFRGEDAADLARVLELAHDLGPAERRALAARARKRVEERYRIAVVARAYLDLYQRVRSTPSPE